MIEYFTRVRDDILQHAKPTCFEDLTVFDLLSFMGSKGYQNGIGLMSAEERTSAGKKGYQNGIGLMKGYEKEDRMKPGRKSSITWTVDLDDASIRKWLEMVFPAKKLHRNWELGNGIAYTHGGEDI